MLGKLIAKHKHVRKMFKSTIEEKVFTYLKDKYSPTVAFSDLSDDATKKLSVSATRFRVYTNKFVAEHLNNFENLRKHLEANGDEILFEWGE